MKKVILSLLCLIWGMQVNAADMSILDFGAKQNSRDNSAAIQAAIDKCALSGGGTVYVPAGTYLTTTIFLKSNVHLFLHNGAVLQGVTDPKAYKGRAIVVGENIKNTSIQGEGCIDGQGNHKNFQFGDDKGRRPHVVLFENCSNVKVKDVFLYNSASWTLRCANNDGVIVNNIRIYSHGNHNCDGIDINSRYVVISDCIVDCDDDGICFKTDIPGFDVEHVTVSNCVIASNCNGIKFGTGSFGTFRNISISNCVIKKASENNVRNWRKMLRGISADTTVISGIALEVVDGGTMDRVVINNISMQDVQTPLFIRLGNRRGKGVLKNIIVSNIVAENQSLITSSITGIPGSYVENVTLRDIMFSYTGGADENDASIVVPEKINEYPENRMFGPVLPAYGLYIRHVKNLTMENIQCRLRKPDYRPAFIFDDVHNVSLNTFQVDLPQGEAPIVYLNESSDVVFSGFRTSEEAPLFLKIDGEKSRRIDVRSVNFDRVRKETECGETVKEGTIYRLNSIL